MKEATDPDKIIRQVEQMEEGDAENATQLWCHLL